MLLHNLCFFLITILGTIEFGAAILHCFFEAPKKAHVLFQLYSTFFGRTPTPTHFTELLLYDNYNPIYSVNKVTVDFRNYPGKVI